MRQKAINFIVIMLVVLLVFTVPGSALIHQSSTVNKRQNIQDVPDASLGHSYQRISYFGNFTYLNAAIMNESKLFLKEPWAGAFYDNYLYVLGSSVNGYAELVRTDSSLLNPILLHIFYGSSFSTVDSVMSASNGVYIGLLNNSGDTVLYLYNDTGLYDVSNILPGDSWSLAYTYNFTTSNYLIFSESTQSSSYSVLYNISSHSPYNFSSQTPKNLFLDAFYYYGNYIYFTGSIQYKTGSETGFTPYVGYIDTQNDKVVNLTNTSLPDVYYNIASDNLAVLNNNIYVGGSNFTLNDNSSMYFAVYNLSSKSFKQLNMSGIFRLSSVTQLFTSAGNVWLATYNATDYYNLNYVGLYDYNTTSKAVKNVSSLAPNFFDNINVLLPGYDFLIGWSYQNNTNELVQFNLSSPSSSLAEFYNDPIGSSYPYFWSGMPQAGRQGFVISGGNGVALESNLTITSPDSAQYKGFFLDSSIIGDIAYAVGQSYAPNDGVFLYAYNLTDNSLTNLSGNFPPSLYSSNASFVQDVNNGSYLTIFGVDNETSTVNPILYSYNIKDGHSTNLTKGLPSNLTSATLYGADMVQSGNATYLLTSSSIGVQLASFNSTGYHYITSLQNGYIVPYSFYYGGFQAMTVANGTLYLTGNNPSNSSVTLMSYSSSKGIINLNYLVDNYTFQTSSISYANGTLYLGGFSASSGESIPQLLAVNLSGMYTQSLSKFLPSYFGQIGGLSASGNQLFLSGGSFPNANYGVLKVETKAVSSVTFISTGLPDGEGWSVAMDGTQMSSTSSSLTFYLPDGTYNFTIGTEEDFASNVTSGSVLIQNSGTAQTEYIGWIRTAYSVSFSDNGLSAGSLWGLSVDGQHYSSTTGRIAVNLKNGTYSFTISGLQGYRVAPGYGNFSVSGSDLNVAVYFFKESSLGTGMLTNYSGAISGQGIFWNGQIISARNNLLLTGGNGFISVPEGGSSITTILNGNNGYYSFVQGSGSTFYVGGNWYMPAGGIDVYKYYTDNSSVQSLNPLLPASWTTQGSGSSLVAMAAGDGVVMLADSPGSGQSLQIGMISSGKFVNLTSQFGAVSGPASIAYGDGSFLMLFDNGATIYNISRNSTSSVTDVSPYMADGVDGSAQYSSYVNGSFYFFNGTYLASISQGSTTAMNLIEISNPYFVQNISGSVYVGNRSVYGTSISVIRNRSAHNILESYGQITDIAASENGYAISGTDMQSFSPILVNYAKLYNITLTPSGLPTGTVWGINFDNVSVSLNGSETNILVPGGTQSISVKSPADHSSLPSTISIQPSSSLYKKLSYNIDFSQLPSYKVQFHETGLPSKTEWNLTVDGFIYSSDSSWINTTLPVGTYTFSIQSLNGYVPVPSQGTLNVNNSGLPLITDVNFSNVQTYSVTLKETGLSTGTTWTADLNGAASKTSTGQIVFNVQKGTYSYSIGNVSSYQSSVSSGTVVVNSNVTIDVYFISSLYMIQFRETGLSSGSTWIVTLGSNSFETNASYLNVYLSNGTYSYEVPNIAGYVSDITTGEIEVNGSDQSISITYAPMTLYQVTFQESGLPAGGSWFAELSGIEKSSNLSSISFFEPNGSYNYSIGTELTNYLPDNSAGSIVISGAGVTVYVNFTDPSPKNEFSMNLRALAQNSDPVVNIVESGLSFGSTLSQWKATINGKAYYSSGNEISASVSSSSTVNYRVLGVNGYDISPQSGYLLVGSSSVTISVRFIPLNYVSLTFQPQGIPQGVSVSLFIAGEDFTFAPSAEMPFLSLELPVGTYSYSTNAAGGYVPLTPSGTIELSGHSSELKISYSLIRYYKVSFVPQNIQGHRFEVAIDGKEYVSNGHDINLSLPEGLYSYAVGSDSSLKPLSSSGSFQLSKTGLTIDVEFVPQQYLVLFKVSNLFTKQWTLTVNGNSFTVSGDYFQTLLTNGTYQYTSTQMGSDKTTQGNFSVLGADSLVKISFPTKTYLVTFVEAGMPSGTLWYVNASSISNSSETNAVGFNIPNGTYTFFISNTSQYYTTNHTVYVKVTGANLTVNVVFYHWAYISGSVLPSNATVQIDGKTVSLTLGKFNVSLSGGNYTITATLPGYHAFSENISISPGKTLNVNIDLKPLHSNNPLTKYVLYAGIALAVVVILSVLVLIMRRKT